MLGGAVAAVAVVGSSLMEPSLVRFEIRAETVSSSMEETTLRSVLECDDCSNKRTALVRSRKISI